MNKTGIPARQKPVLAMLIDDHRHVHKLAQEYKKVSDDKKKKQIVDEACIALIAHTEIEEQIFYPYLREQDPKAFGDQLDEGIVEHGSVKDLVADLRQMDPGDDLYDAKFTVVGEFVDHHVKEEEDELFPMIIKKDIDLSDLTEKMQTMKDEIVKRES